MRDGDASMTTARHEGPEPPGIPAPISDHAALFADHANLLAAVDQLGVTMCLLDERGRVLWVNDTWRRFAVANGGNPALCSQGSDYLAQVRGMAAGSSKPEIEAALHAVLSGDSETETLDYTCHTPTARRWFQARFRGFAAGEHRRVLVVHEEITARKLAEEARAESTQLLLRLQNVATLGAFTRGVVHDFNNLLTVMIGNTEIARMHAGADAEMQDLLGAIAGACQQARLLTQQMLHRGREHSQSRPQVDVARVVRDVAALLRAAAPATLRIDVRCAEAPSVQADASQLHQLLMNLATNARHAMQDRGTLTIALEASDERPRSLPRDHRRWLSLRVTDTGPGIDPAVLPRIFEPFFTTKSVEEGTGLGLTIVQEIARGHGGTIEVVSPEGAGPTFLVWLPASPRAAAAPGHDGTMHV